MSQATPARTLLPTQLWVYQAAIDKVIDGDTLVARIDHGFHHYSTAHVRLAKLNAPEINVSDNATGREARDYVLAWAAEGINHQPHKTWGWPFVLACHGFMDGQPVVTIWRRSDGNSLNQDLIEAGNAVFDPTVA